MSSPLWRDFDPPIVVAYAASRILEQFEDMQVPWTWWLLSTHLDYIPVPPALRSDVLDLVALSLGDEICD